MNKIASQMWISCLIILNLLSTTTFGWQENVQAKCSKDEHVVCSVDKFTHCQRTPSIGGNNGPQIANVTHVTTAIRRKLTSTELLIQPHITTTTHENDVNVVIEFVVNKVADLEAVEVSIVEAGQPTGRCYRMQIQSEIGVKKSARFIFNTTDVLDFSRSYKIALQPFPSAVDGEMEIVVETPEDPKHERLLRSAMCLSCQSPIESQFCQNALGESLVAKVLAKNESSCRGEYDGVVSTVSDYRGKIDCSAGESHPLAYKFEGAFVSVTEHPNRHAINFEFIAAEDDYCFHAYYVDLYETHTMEKGDYHVRQSKTIKIEDMDELTVNNQTVRIARGAFENVNDGVYQLRYHPVEYAPGKSTSGHGRCLCPRPGSTQGRTGFCMCTQTVFSNLVMSRPTSPGLVTGRPMEDDIRGRHPSHQPLVFSFITLVVTLTFAVICILVCGVCVFLAIRSLHRHKPSFYEVIHPQTTDGTYTDADGSKSDQTQLIELTPVVANYSSMKVALVYSHDCDAHVSAVHKLAELIEHTLGCEVMIDLYKLNELTENKSDAAYKMIRDADKVVLIHSAGAYHRYQVKLAGNGVLRRSDACNSEYGFFDDVFLQQLDYITDDLHRGNNAVSKYMSVHFTYTPSNYLLQQLMPAIRYELPGQTSNLVSNLIGTHPNRSASRPRIDIPYRQRLIDAVDEMSKMCRSNEDWLKEAHVRVEKQGDLAPPPLPEGIAHLGVGRHVRHVNDPALLPSTSMVTRTEIDTKVDVEEVEEPQVSVEVVDEKTKLCNKSTKLAELAKLNRQMSCEDSGVVLDSDDTPRREIET